MLKSVFEDTKRQFDNGNTVVQLIIINVAVFIIVNLIGVLLIPFVGIGGGNETAFQGLLAWLEVPSDGMKLLTRPWTILTYMFLHTGLMHILFNMLFLYWFGQIVQNYLGNSRILGIYILGGLAGFLVFFLSANLIPGFKDYIGFSMLGASAGVMAIVMAAATIAPTHTMNLLFIGPVQIRYIALFLIFIDLISVRQGANTGGHLAHLGGVGMGYFIIQQLQKGTDYTLGFNRLFDKVKGFFAKIFKGKPQGPHMAYKNQENINRKGGFKPKTKNRPFRKTKPNAKSDASSSNSLSRQEQIDAILDKIKVTGYDSLSSDEKEFLFKASKDD